MCRNIRADYLMASIYRAGKFLCCLWPCYKSNICGHSVKIKVTPSQAMRAQRGVEVFLTSPVVVTGWSSQCFGHFTLAKGPCTHFTGGPVGRPQDRLDVCTEEKLSCPHWGSNSETSSP
jgi:hypothetical protein